MTTGLPVEVLEDILMVQENVPCRIWSIIGAKGSKKIGSIAKATGRVIVKSALFGATTGATLTGIAAVGFNFISSPECQALINNVANRAGTWFFKTYVESAAINANQNLDTYLYLGNQYLKSLDL